MSNYNYIPTSERETKRLRIVRPALPEVRVEPDPIPYRWRRPDLAIVAVAVACAVAAAALVITGVLPLY